MRVLPYTGNQHKTKSDMTRKIAVVIKWKQSFRQVKKSSDKALPTQYKLCAPLLVIAVLYN